MAQPLLSGATVKVEPVAGSSGVSGGVQGMGADGATTTGNPVLVGGSDGTNTQSLLVDTSGRPMVVGAAADGAAVSGNPVSIAGTDGTNSVVPLVITAADNTALTKAVKVYAILSAYDGSTVDIVRNYAQIEGAGSSGGTGCLGVGCALLEGTTVRQMRAANTASNTTGTGLLGAGLLAFDGTNYQLVRTVLGGDNTVGTGIAGSAIMARNSGAYFAVGAPSNHGDGDGAQRSLVTAGYYFNPSSTWDRPRTPGLGTAAIGRFRTAIKSTPTVGTGTAYAAGDVIGVINTLSNAVRISGGSGVIRSVTVSDKSGVADIAIALRVWFFDSNPSGSTFTDNSALNIVDADITKVIGFVDLAGTGGAATGAEVWSARACDLAFVASGSSSIFMVLESRGAIAANAGTTDWQVTTCIEQD